MSILLLPISHTFPSIIKVGNMGRGSNSTGVSFLLNYHRNICHVSDRDCFCYSIIDNIQVIFCFPCNINYVIGFFNGKPNLNLNVLNFMMHTLTTCLPESNYNFFKISATQILAELTS